ALQLRYLHLLLLDLGRCLAAIIAIPRPVTTELVGGPTNVGLDLVLGDAGIPTQAPGVRHIRAVVDRELRPVVGIDAEARTLALALGVLGRLHYVQQFERLPQALGAALLAILERIGIQSLGRHRLRARTGTDQHVADFRPAADFADQPDALLE